MDTMGWMRFSEADEDDGRNKTKLMSAWMGYMVIIKCKCHPPLFVIALWLTSPAAAICRWRNILEHTVEQKMFPSIEIEMYFWKGHSRCELYCRQRTGCNVVKQRIFKIVKHTLEGRRVRTVDRVVTFAGEHTLGRIRGGKWRTNCTCTPTVARQPKT